MKFERSCGAVVFTEIEGEIKYVIVKEKHGTFGFPKGHVEKDESERKTALREVREETGLLVNLIKGFREKDRFTFVYNGKTIDKSVTYFLANYQDQPLIAQETEIGKICLINFDEALNTLQFESQRRILTKANDFIMNLAQDK